MFQISLENGEGKKQEHENENENVPQISRASIHQWKSIDMLMVSLWDIFTSKECFDSN